MRRRLGRIPLLALVAALCLLLGPSVPRGSDERPAPAAAQGGATLSASRTSAPAGSTVTVTWNAIASPTSTDWVGLYTPGDTDLRWLAWLYVGCS